MVGYDGLSPEGNGDELSILLSLWPRALTKTTIGWNRNQIESTEVVYTFYFHCLHFVCLAYFTLLDQKRKQPLGGIGIESNLRKLFILFTFIVDIFVCFHGEIS